MISLKLISTLNGKDFNTLTEEEKKDFEDKVIKKIEGLGYKVHKNLKTNDIKK